MYGNVRYDQLIRSPLARGAEGAGITSARRMSRCRDARRVVGGLARRHSTDGGGGSRVRVRPVSGSPRGDDPDRARDREPPMVAVAGVRLAGAADRRGRGPRDLGADGSRGTTESALAPSPGAPSTAAAPRVDTDQAREKQERTAAPESLDAARAESPAKRQAASGPPPPVAVDRLRDEARARADNAPARQSAKAAAPAATAPSEADGDCHRAHTNDPDRRPRPVHLPRHRPRRPHRRLRRWRRCRPEGRRRVGECRAHSPLVPLRSLGLGGPA